LAPSLEPRAVPIITSMFGKGDAEQQLVEVRLLDRIDAPEVTRELARLAVVGRDGPVRGEAADAFARHDTADVIERLIGSLPDPLGIEVLDEPGAVGVLEVEDEASILRKTYHQQVVQLTRPANIGVPGWILGPFAPTARRNPPTARQKLDHDVAAAWKMNAQR